MGEKGRLECGEAEFLSLSEVLMLHTSSSAVGKGSSRGLKTLSALLSLGIFEEFRGDLPHMLEGQALGSSHPALSPESKRKKCSPSQGSGVQGQIVCG